MASNRFRQLDRHPQGDQVLMRRLRIEGFFIPDFLQHGAEFMPRLQQWLDAYGAMLAGRHIGKVIVSLPGGA